ncbi:MAG TPA: B-box zinc finger protein [Pyrinomonadaceae bacterium]|jgi:hypothetical protein
MKAETEIWEVSTPDGVFQADLPTLKQWVAEGVVLPTDRVRKGSLKWIDAGRAPMLRRVFSGEESVEAPAPHSPSDLGLAGDDADGAAPGPAHEADARWAERPPAAGAHPLAYSCHFHPEQAAALVCRTCGETFCRACPNRVGTSSVLLCSLCGGFCDPLERLTERLALYARQGEGFGLSDFQQALAYPFRHLGSLLGGALLYGFLLLAGARGQLLATALVFGCISLVVRRVAYGNLGRDFLPDFSEFSFWDDVVVPCALGVGVTVVTLGPTLLLVGALLFGWLNGPQSPSRLALPPQAAVEQAQKEAARQGVTGDDMGTLINGGTAEQEAELEKKVNSMRPGAQMARQLEETKREDATFGLAARLLEHPGLVLVLGLLALGWAAFYHPMALLVAGWTESLKSVLNPLVGLDTMRHMGLTYFKAFAMYLAVQAVSFLLAWVVGLVTAPFNMPLVGNLPGTFLGGVVAFYTSLVIACVLGLSLFKSADRLGIELD